MLTKMAECDATEYVDTTVDFGFPYKYFVQAVESPLRQSEISEVTSVIPLDTFPPAVPVGLSAVAGTNAIELAWQRNTENDFSGYHVYRSVDGGAFERVAGPIDSPTYSDRAIEAGRKYAYAVSAIDNASNESERSMVVEVTAQ
jgi:predicted phage tail protein